MTTKQPSRSKSKAPATPPAVVAAIYVRVSTEEQANESFGLAAQLTRTQAIVKGWEVAPQHLYRDEGISGTPPPEDRPGLAALLAAVESAEATVVIVLSLDRLGARPTWSSTSWTRSARAPSWCVVPHTGAQIDLRNGE
jgi:Resolvase, N terminal domain